MSRMMSRAQRLLSLLSLTAFASPWFVNSLSVPKVAFVGSSNQDLTSYTNTFPVLGETVLGSSFETSSGGKGANQARAAGRLCSVCGTEAHMVCRVGDDVFGRDMLDNLKASGVSCDEETAVLKDGTASGVASIVVDNESGDNSIIVTPGANFMLSAEDVENALTSLEQPLAAVVTQLEIQPGSALQAMKSGKTLGATTILNTAPAPVEEGALDEFYPHVDILIPNETELRTICGKVGDDSVDETTLAESLLDKGVGTVVCTLGARGAVIVQRGGADGTTQIDYVDAPTDLPARQEPVMDTIGAGDAFCGALSCYISAGLDLVEAAEKACGFASMSVRRRGATYPTAEELPDSLKLKVPTA